MGPALKPVHVPPNGIPSLINKSGMIYKRDTHGSISPTLTTIDMLEQTAWSQRPETLEGKSRATPIPLPINPPWKPRSGFTLQAVLTGGVEVDDVLHGEVAGLCSPQPACHEAQQQDVGQPGLRGHHPPRPCSCGGPGSAAADGKLT